MENRQRFFRIAEVGGLGEGDTFDDPQAGEVFASAKNCPDCGTVRQDGVLRPPLPFSGGLEAESETRSG